LSEIWYNTNRHRDGRYLAENRTISPAGHVFVSADTRQKSSFAKQGKLLNLGHLDFDIVSDFDIRISDFFTG